MFEGRIMITVNPQFLEAPDFWITDWSDVNRFLDNLGGRVRTIGESQGGHPIRAVFYGDKEPVEHQTSRFSAQLAGHMEDFFECGQRTRPVILVISTIHGGEVEGCAASINLCSLLETGTDLRGRFWESLRETAAAMRLVVVPVAQPDGRIRSAVRHLVGATIEELVYYCHGEPKNPGAEPVDWNWFLRHHPVPVDDMEFLGGYFNDAGVNIDLDDFFSSKKAPETEALLDLARDEIPDCVVVLHTHGPGPFMSQPNHFVSQRCRYLQAQIGTVVGERHDRENLRPAWRPTTQAHGATYFNLPTALHHVSGALPLGFEFPHGFDRNPYTFDEIMDVGMTMFDELFQYVTKWRRLMNGL